MAILKYKGTHQPKGMLIEVDEKEVKRVLDGGDYERLTDIPKDEVSKPKEQPSMKWTESKIFDWIKENKIPIDYKISRDRKDDILEKLKLKGYIDDSSD